MVRLLSVADGAIVDASLFVRLRAHGIIVSLLVSLELGLVQARLGVQSVLVQVALLVELGVNVGGLEQLTLLEGFVQLPVQSLCLLESQGLGRLLCNCH